MSARESMLHYLALRNITQIAGGITMLLLVFGLVGRWDYEEEIRLEALRQQRAVELAAGACLPQPGQETRWTWQGAGAAARLECRIFESDPRTGAARQVMAEAPSGLAPLVSTHRAAR